MNKQSGGSGRSIPKFKQDENSPFSISGNSQQSRVENSGNSSNYKGNSSNYKGNSSNYKGNSGNNFDDNDTSKSTGFDFEYPATVDIPNPNDPYSYAPWQKPKYTVPVIKTYNISFQGMDGSMVRASNIFEDILPESKVAMNRMISLSERQILHTYIRSILVRRGDGEEVAFDDKKPELMNILSYLKILEINPYHYSRVTDNHLRTLSDNFVMFKSCYPIRVNEKRSVSCAKDGIGSNVRIYSMSVYDELSNLISDRSSGIVKNASDVWREIMFYTFVREEILKKKICPHFPYMHAYYVTDNNSIDFDKIKKIKKTINSMDHTKQHTNDIFRNEMAREGIDGIVSTEDGYNFVVKMNSAPKTSETYVVKLNDSEGYKNSRLLSADRLNYDGKEISVNARSSKCVVAITEAPDINIIDWSTRTYVVENKPGMAQVSSGSHSDMTWKSVLFQIYVSYLTMVSKRILIREFSWEKNIYIKNLRDTGPVGFWKYNVRQIPFYIPNMKALVMFDSSFDQVQNGYTDSMNNFEFKILGDCFGTIPPIGMITYGETVPRDELYQEMFNNIFDTNIFTTAFRTYGGISPGPEIINLINAIRGESDDIFKDPTNAYYPMDIIVSNLITKLLTHFGFFLHNKMGLMVDKFDSPQIYEAAYNIGDCKKGEIIAVTDGPDSYVWATYISAGRNGIHNVLTKDLDTETYHIQQFNRRDIKRAYGVVTQNTNMDTKIGSDDELIETYNVQV